jgi:alpha-glucosidase
MKHLIRNLASLCILFLSFGTPIKASAQTPKVIRPPASFFKIVRDSDRDVARGFYKKYININGLPVVAAGVVADQALHRTHEIVTHMLAGRPDIVDQMVKTGLYLIIIGKDQVYTDMPEYRNSPNPEYQNERVRGTGGKPTSFGEENLLSLPLDRYDDESIGVHEFCHTIDGALRTMDTTWIERRNAAFQNAMDKGLYKFAYAASNPGEYWAEICQSYFDCNRPNNWNHGPIINREQLRTYDPVGYQLVRETFNLKPGQDWRYKWLQPLPNVTRPPAKFKVDPYYTKFTWAREFTVVGKGAADAALLRANDTVRKMFAYRHDVLKALIADGVKLVVLGRNEALSDLPEFRNSHADILSREQGYDRRTKSLVVPEENVMADSNGTGTGGNAVIRVMTDALYEICANRPVDPNWDNRGRAVQQYELRVTRLDVRFGDRIASIHRKSTAAGKWKGTSAIESPKALLTAGILAYFDAAGQDNAPNDTDHPIRTREQLAAYDAELFSLVRETMAYFGHVDWRASQS